MDYALYYCQQEEEQQPIDEGMTIVPVPLPLGAPPPPTQEALERAWVIFPSDENPLVLHWHDPLDPGRTRNDRRIKKWPNWHCVDCGTNQTPTRRSGPAGKVTLCNRCGLRRKNTKAGK